MNRTDRLLAIVLELQAKKMLRAEDLAATFEVTKRTIYRDVQALCEAGVPVVSLPRQGYALIEGYFLPPLRFTIDEAMMLLLGSDFAAQTFDTDFDAEYRMAAQSANRKIEAVLADDLRGEVDYLQRNIRFITCSVPVGRERLQRLRFAILQRKTVQFVYQARFPTDANPDNNQEGLAREVDPYALIHLGDTWQLVGYCHLRLAIRHFRLDRIDDLVILNRQFERPLNFKFSQTRTDVGEITVRALFDYSIIRWVRESKSFYQVAEEECPDGLLITFQVHQEDQIFQWLFSWGAHVHIVEPESLRERLAQEATQMVQNLTKKQVSEISNLG